MDKKLLHVKLVNAVTEYDRRQAKKKFYNIHALAMYIGKIQDIEENLNKGMTIENALKQSFCGQLLRFIAKRIGADTSQFKKWD